VAQENVVEHQETRVQKAAAGVGTAVVVARGLTATRMECQEKWVHMAAALVAAGVGGAEMGGAGAAAGVQVRCKWMGLRVWRVCWVMRMAAAAVRMKTRSNRGQGGDRHALQTWQKQQHHWQQVTVLLKAGAGASVQHAQMRILSTLTIM
jgi:hypothetical protein